jgi:hypothetical protein
MDECIRGTAARDARTGFIYLLPKGIGITFTVHTSLLEVSGDERAVDDFRPSKV